MGHEHDCRIHFISTLLKKLSYVDKHDSNEKDLAIVSEGCLILLYFEF